MATFEIPPTPPNTDDSRKYVRPEDEQRAEFIPVLLQQAHDDLARSRMREAFWISVVVHLILIFSLALVPKWLPGYHPVQVASAEDLLKDKDLTFIQLPSDEQKVTAKPNTKFLSDKDRVATSRTPSIDRKTLQELRDSAANRRPGPPNPPGPQMAQNSSPVPAPPQGDQSGAAGRQQGAIPAAPNSTPNIPPLAKPNPFAGARSAGSIIAEAARNSQRGGYGGAGGDYGQPFSPSGGIRSNMDVLSDTQGVDFGPYLSRVLQSVRVNWYNLIPEVARPPIMKKGKVSIEFVILKDGKVAGMRVVGPSGDVALDRAAWGGITGSNPFSPLPSEFHGPYLALRFHFLYNPDKADLE